MPAFYDLNFDKFEKIAGADIHEGAEIWSNLLNRNSYAKYGTAKNILSCAPSIIAGNVNYCANCSQEIYDDDIVFSEQEEELICPDCMRGVSSQAEYVWSEEDDEYLRVDACWIRRIYVFKSEDKTLVHLNFADAYRNISDNLWVL